MALIPCRTCENRTPTCHAQCKLYLSWKKEHDIEKKKIKRKKDNDRNYEDSLFAKRPRRR